MLNRICWTINAMLRAPKKRRQKTTYEKGYNHRWKEASKRFRRKNPFCAIQGPHCTVEAEVVDHIVPHRKPRPGWYERFWDAENWQSACKACHDQKTLNEMAPITIVTGPPGAGKTYYCNEQLRRYPEAVVFDLDRLAAALNPAFEDYLTRPDDVASVLLGFRDLILKRVKAFKRRCFVIITNEEEACNTAMKIGAVLKVVRREREL